MFLDVEILQGSLRVFEASVLLFCAATLAVKVYTYFLLEPGKHWPRNPVAAVYRRLDVWAGYWLEPLVWLALSYFFFKLLFFVGGQEHLHPALRALLIAGLLSLYGASVLPWIGPYNLFLALVTRNPPLGIDKDRHFPQHRLLEDPENWRRLREELDGLLAGNPAVPFVTDIFRDVKVAPTEEVEQGRGWRVFVLRTRGKDAQQNCRQVPFLASLLKEMPMVKTALFSILDGGKEITPHRGHFKGVLRYHLGLIVPDDLPPYIVCGGERYEWKEGEGVLFDDMYVHSAHNPSRSPRVVLFLDVERLLIPGLAQLNRWVGWIVEHHPMLKVLDAAIHRESSAGAAGASGSP